MSLEVILTGPEGDEGILALGLDRLGVEVARMPLLEVAPPADRGPLLKAVRGFSLYDSVAFPGPRSVTALAVALGEAGVADRCKEALVVGPGTAARATEAGFLVVVEGTDSPEPGAAGLLASIDRRRYPVGTQRILLPASERARPELLDGLRSRGAKVDAVPAYSIRPVANPEERIAGLLRSRRLGESEPAPLLVASPSAAEVLASVSGPGLRRLPRLVAIGPTTARALEGLGLTVAARASAPTPEGIRDALLTIQDPRP